MPKHFQNNFEKGQKMTFLAPELAKITISEGEILEKKKSGSYMPLELKIHHKVGLTYVRSANLLPIKFFAPL